MARQTFKIEGLRELDDALTELPKSTARAVLVRTLKQEGQPIRDDGEAAAPRLTGGLKQSYTVGTKLSRRQKQANPKESMVEVYIGPGPAPKGVQTEFGNAHQAPQPHLRPAFDGNVMRVLDGIRDRLAENIEKTRARIARRAEILAAKIAAGRK
ncbi:MAG: HK97 gp10 family phage protein [Pseudomonadota bacterium]